MPRLSIVVPTRERCDTLVHTLRTLVEQGFQDMEIVVSDNASGDRTKEVVRSFADPRVRYINTGQRVGMAENWEYGLRHVRGDFVTFIGDDDGFLPGAIDKAMRILHNAGALALVWEKIEYCWPDYVQPDLRNWLSLRLGPRQVRLADARKQLQRTLLFRDSYTRLPCLYNAIVSMDAVRKVIAVADNGAFFNAVTPDVFSGIALGAVLEQYLLTDYPLSINGASRHSNGAAFARPNNDSGNPETEPTRRFLAENAIAYDRRVRFAPSTTVCVMGELLLARQYLASLGLPEPHWGAYIRALVRAARHSLAPDELLASARHSEAAVRTGTSVPAAGSFPPRALSADIGIGLRACNMRIPGELVANVYDAAILASSLLPEAPAFGNSSVREFTRRLLDFLSLEAVRLYRAH